MPDQFDAMLEHLLDPNRLAARPAAPGVQPLTPEEEESVLHRAASGVMGGVGYLANSLDKGFGGRAVRGVLGGKPQELLSAIPFSDALGITSQENAVSGEDLAKQWSLLQGEGTRGEFEARDLVGPGISALLDPGTYLTLGSGTALTSAGQAAKASGTLAKTAAGRIAAGQGALAGFGVPFMKPGLLVGTGPVAEKVAAAGGRLADKALYSGLGRSASALFDPRVHGATTEFLQRAGRDAAGRLPAAQAEAAGKVLGLQRQAAGAGLLNESDMLRGMVEGSVKGPFADPAVDATARGVAGGMGGLLKDAISRENELGIPTQHLHDSEAGYFPRSMTELTNPTKGYARPQNPLSPYHPGLMKREEILKDIPGGTLTVNQLAKDAAVRQLPMDQAAAHLQQTYHVGDRGQAARLADWVKSLDPQISAGGLDVFGNSVFRDLGKRLASSAKSTTMAETLHDALSRAAGPAGQAGPGAERLAEALKRAGLTDPAGELAQIEKLQALGKVPHGLIDDAHRAFSDLYVPRNVADDASRVVQGFNRPEATGPFLKFVDSFTSMFKSLNTALWPAKYTRDFAQGVFQNLAHGNLDPALGALNPKAYFAPYQYANTVLREGGGVLPAEVTARIPGLAHLPPEQATARLADEMAAWKISGPDRGNLRADVMGSPAAAKAVELPGSRQPSLLDIAREGATGAGIGRKDFLDPLTGRPSLQAFKAGAANPLNIAKVGDRTATTFGPAVTGGKLMEWNDDLQRGSAYIAKRLQGFNPEQAAAASVKAHYDMGNMTQFDRSVMRRLVPFWAWNKANIPAVLEDAVTRPGGLTAQAAKLTASMRNDEGFMPEHLREGLALPVGQGDGGTQRFLSHLGLNFEDLDLFGVQPTAAQTVARTAQHALGVANPLIKAPLEVATDRQFYSGRDLSDLHGAPTGNVLVDQAVMNSPLARLLTTARTLADDRKGLGAKLVNTLGPAKVTDVDMAKAKDVAAREYATELLKQNPAVRRYEETYVPAGKLNQLSPAELTLYRLYKNLETQARERGKAAKGR